MKKKGYIFCYYAKETKKKVSNPNNNCKTTTIHPESFPS